MSRGHGWIQQALFTTIVHLSRKLMTFADIREHIAQARDYPAGVTMLPEFERSVRRALKKLVDDQTIVAVGEGGPGDPYRYGPNPMLIAMFSSKEEYERVKTMMEADPGGTAAADKAARAMMR